MQLPDTVCGWIGKLQTFCTPSSELARLRNTVILEIFIYKIIQFVNFQVN